MHDISLAGTDAEIESTYVVMQQLRPGVARSDYLPRVREMEKLAGYRLVCLSDKEHIAAVAGFRITASLAWGKYVYVDDLVCDEALRSSGHGAALLAWIGIYGRVHGCGELHLDSGVQRFAAHRFYLREHMDITCHHFRIVLA